MDYKSIVHSDTATVLSVTRYEIQLYACTPTQLSIQGWSHETVGNTRPIIQAAQAISAQSKPPLHRASCLQLLSLRAMRPPGPQCVAPDRVARRVLRHVASARLCRTANSSFCWCGSSSWVVGLYVKSSAAPATPFRPHGVPLCVSGPDGSG